VSEEEALEDEAQSRRCIALGVALAGKDCLRSASQLLAPHPEIPSEFDLSDYRRLLRAAQTIAVSSDSRFAWLPRSVLFSPRIFVGARRFTAWEARSKVVRRAIEYLNGR
jgi:hypothetical protein